MRTQERLMCGVMVLLVALCSTAYAQSTSWNRKSGDWSALAGWSAGEPTVAHVAQVHNGFLVTVNASNEVCKILDIDWGSEAEIAPSGGLAVVNYVVVNNGLFTIQGSGTSDIGYIGESYATNGTVRVTGATATWDNSDNLYVGYVGCSSQKPHPG